MSHTMTFRFAEEADCGIILNFIRGLAEYEKLSDQVVATEELLREWIFEKKKAEVLFVCEDGKEVGIALFFHNFSTFLGRAGASRKRLREGTPEAAGQDHRGTGMRPPGMGVPGLEQAVGRSVSFSGSGAHG